MDPSTPAENAEPQVFFRPTKKRKQFRQRAEATESATATQDNQPVTASPVLITHDSASVPPVRTDDDEPSETEGSSVAEALRLRNARKSRFKGVEFRPESASASKDEPSTEHNSLVPKEDPLEAFSVSKRFAPQQGLVGELVNKHMEEYIESELARRHAADKAAKEAAEAAAAGTSATTQLQPGLSLAADPTKHIGGPTRQGRLQEVDLGDEARERNAAMTEQARRRLAGEAIDEEEERQRARLGKDGKPWRGRKRRASDDIKRDEMVEALMRENRLDVYDVQDQAESSAEAGEDMPADERIAEQFRREFMDAMAARRQARRRAPAPPPRPGAKQEEILRGPKLGGSRNARAAMRDILLSQQEAKKKR